MNKKATYYRAVDIHQLRDILGTECSPDILRPAYVIGPDVTGRLCHCGSYCSMPEAKAAATAMNAEFELKGE